MRTPKENCDRIHQVVAEHYGLKPSDLWDKKKKSYYITKARYVAWSIANCLFHYSQNMIGKQYRYSQSVVSYGLLKVETTAPLLRMRDALVKEYGEDIAPAPTTTAADFEQLMEIKAKRFQEQVEANGGKVVIRRYKLRKDAKQRPK